MKSITSRMTTVILMLVMLGIGATLSRMTVAPAYVQADTPSAQNTASPSATETIPPYTPLATLTPSQTLRPPPTFEPPTSTRAPTLTPTVTLTSTIDLSISIPGLNGAETPTPSSTPGCQPRKDWELVYVVQRDDALARIAAQYNTTVDALAEANCLRDVNLIVIGQELRVPGDTHPQQPEYECVLWEVLTPANGTLAIEAEGQLTFNWHGPRAPRNLIRIIEPDGGMVEIVIELRQNETVDMAEKFTQGGTYTWYVFPLDYNFRQINCREGGPWTFTKPQSPTPVPTPEPGGP